MVWKKLNVGPQGWVPSQTQLLIHYLPHESQNKNIPPFISRTLALAPTGWVSISRMLRLGTACSDQLLTCCFFHKVSWIPRALRPQFPHLAPTCPALLVPKSHPNYVTTDCAFQVGTGNHAAHRGSAQSKEMVGRKDLKPRRCSGCPTGG